MFKPFYGKCSNPDCTRGDRVLIPVKSGLCQHCNHAKKQAAKGDKAKKPYLSPVSDKRAKEQRVYSVARVLFLKHNPLCKAKIAGICNMTSKEVHHMRGRVSELYLDQQFWLPVCPPCHRWIELNPEKAKEKGWSESRLAQ